MTGIAKRERKTTYDFLSNRRVRNYVIMDRQDSVEKYHRKKLTMISRVTVSLEPVHGASISTLHTKTPRSGSEVSKRQTSYKHHFFFTASQVLFHLILQIQCRFSILQSARSGPNPPCTCGDFSVGADGVQCSHRQAGTPILNLVTESYIGHVSPRTRFHRSLGTSLSQRWPGFTSGRGSNNDASGY